MQEADHLLIPLLDGTHALAQVARVNDARALVHITDQRTNADAQVTPIPAKAVLATLSVDRGSLTPGQWPVVGYEALPKELGTRSEHLNDAGPLDAAIVEAFANACLGLFPWDGFPDPDLFTAFLRNPKARPPKARTTAHFSKLET